MLRLVKPMMCLSSNRQGKLGGVDVCPGEARVHGVGSLHPTQPGHQRPVNSTAHTAQTFVTVFTLIIYINFCVFTYSQYFPKMNINICKGRSTLNFRKGRGMGVWGSSSRKIWVVWVQISRNGANFMWLYGSKKLFVSFWRGHVLFDKMTIERGSLNRSDF